MNPISRLFGTEKVIDGLMSAADNMWETTEEKSKAKMMFLRLYEPFKTGQRIFAVLVGVPFVFVHSLTALFWFVIIGFAAINGPGENYYFAASELKKVALMNNETLGVPFAWIVAFYFLGGAGEGMIKAYIGKFSAKKAASK